MKKHTFKTGVAILLASNIFANAVSAQEVTTEAENQAKQEEKMTFSSATNTENKTNSGAHIPVYDGVLAWKLVHCSLLEKGFAWEKPTSEYANATNCGTKGGALIAGDKLAEQRQRVLDLINSQIKKVEQKVSENTLSISEMEQYFKFINTENNFIEKNELTIGNMTLIMTRVNEFLKKNPNLPLEVKENIIFGLLKIQHEKKKDGKEYISQEIFNNLITIRNFDEIGKVMSKYATLSETELATLLSPKSFDTINIVKNKNEPIYYANFYLTQKNGKFASISEYNIELKNAPKWIVLSDSDTIREDFTLSVLEKDINYAENIPEEFQIVLTHKTTGKIFTKNMKIRVLEKEDEVNVLNFTLPKLLEIFSKNGL